MTKTIAIVALAAGLSGALITRVLDDHSQPEITVHAQDRNVGLTFAPIVKKATPAVVNISSTINARDRRNSGSRRQQPSMEDFFGEFFGSPFGGRGGPSPEPPRRRGGLGSGVIVTADGYILTNNHVVEDADQVKVALSDRREFDAKVVGTDPQTDIAVLKINASSLPVLPMSDSSKAQIGDIALAIGNPFGLRQTVTMGIIGATGRSGLNIEQYEDFIQTDAAINPGNSGGALVNSGGQLSGINTAILSSGGGNQGIGFAIPINLAREVMDQLIKTGKVTRGYMGVGIQDVTPELAREFKLKNPSGVLITRVEPGEPGEKAGLQVGDVVTAVEGSPVVDSNALRLRVSRSAPGSTVRLTVNRNGTDTEVPVTLAQLRAGNQSGGDEPGRDGERGGNPSALGVAVDDITPEVARQLQRPANAGGVVVTNVSPDSPASEAGLRRGDVIQQVDRKNVSNAREFEQAVRQSTGDSVLLLVNTRGAVRFIVIDRK